MITLDNTLWKNIDIIANKLLPVLGELQFGTASKRGALDSHALIMDDLVTGALNIASTHSADGEQVGGVTNFIYRLATIINAPTIATKGVDLSVYDVLKELLNGFLNARSTNQPLYGKNIIPDVSGDNVNKPFHNLVQSSVIAGTSDDASNFGVISSAIVNIVQFAGVFSSYPDTVWKGAMFVVQSVASLLNGFLPQLQNYKVSNLDAKLAESVAKGYTAGNTLTNTVNLENLGKGINRFTIKTDGSTEELGRSWIKIKSIKADKGTWTFTGDTSATLDPEARGSIGISGSLTADELGSTNAAVVTFTVTYQIVGKDGKAYSDEYTSDFTRTMYYYVSAQKDLYSQTYSSDSATGFAETLTGVNKKAPRSPQRIKLPARQDRRITLLFPIISLFQQTIRLRFPTPPYILTAQVKQLLTSDLKLILLPAVRNMLQLRQIPQQVTLLIHLGMITINMSTPPKLWKTAQP